MRECNKSIRPQRLALTEKLIVYLNQSNTAINTTVIYSVNTNQPLITTKLLSDTQEAAKALLSRVEKIDARFSTSMPRKVRAIINKLVGKKLLSKVIPAFIRILMLSDLWCSLRLTCLRTSLTH